MGHNCKKSILIHDYMQKLQCKLPLKYIKVYICIYWFSHDALNPTIGFQLQGNGSLANHNKCLLKKKPL